MSCPLEQELTAYVDDALDEVARRKVEAHLPGCAACSGTLALLRRTNALWANAPAPRPSPALRARVLAEIDRPTFLQRLRGLLRPVVLVPAGALAAGVIASVVVTRSDPGDEALALESLQDPAQLELALNLDELDDLEVLGLENPDDLEVITHLDELEAMP
ncbi:MAG: zf-HC2 domain-containing protein [Myxococcaceae bacterium]|nr:zf-HC2 domain-containing protein [Myxococcaceae bacterium]